MIRRFVPRAVLAPASAAATVLAVTAAIIPPAYATGPVHCVTTFTATFGEGPDAGLSLRGKLSIVLMPNGKIVGELTHPGDEPAKVAGELRNRRLLGLSFDLPSGRRVFATGKSFHLVPPCDDLPIGGKTHGPRPGDSGVWFNAFWHHA
jgi:hypothetical protein